MPVARGSMTLGFLASLPACAIESNPMNDAKRMAIAASQRNVSQGAGRHWSNSHAFRPCDGGREIGMVVHEAS